MSSGSDSIIYSNVWLYQHVKNRQYALFTWGIISIQGDHNKTEPMFRLGNISNRETKPHYNRSIVSDKIMFRHYGFYSVIKLKENISHLLTLDFKEIPKLNIGSVLCWSLFSL
jgi:hypothetical protein